jgi:hypothetical protein
LSLDLPCVRCACVLRQGDPPGGSSSRQGSKQQQQLAVGAGGQEVVLFFGIIDVLQVRRCGIKKAQ